MNLQNQTNRGAAAKRSTRSVQMIGRRITGVCGLMAFVLSTSTVAAQTTWYVDDDGAPASGCTSWVNRCPDLQTALALAISGDQIWVATGTYKPTPGTDRTATFQLINGVEIYGGFDGTETTLEERAITSAPIALYPTDVVGNGATR